MKNSDVLAVSIYVGTNAKYNNGSIFGEWLDLSNYSDMKEFYQACKELHSDEEDPEYMFQNWENIPEALIGESWLSENIFEVIEAISALDETCREAFQVWIDHMSHDLASENIIDLLDSFHEDFQGQYKNEEDFAYEIVEQCYELPEIAQTYFNYEKFARDLFMCDYWLEDGFVFRNS